MKHFIFTLFLCCLLIPGSAQNKKEILTALRNGPSIETNESAFKHNHENIPAIEITLHAEENEIEKSIRKFCEINLSAPLKKDHGIFVSSFGSIATIPGDSVSLAFRVDKVSYGTSLSLAIRNTRAWLNPQTGPDQIIAAKAILTRFAVEFYSEYYKEWIEDETKESDKLNKELGRINNSINAAAGNIKSEEGKKANAEASMRTLKNEMQDLQSEIQLLEEAQKKQSSHVERINNEAEVSRKDLDNAQSLVNTKIASGDTESKDYKKAVKELEKQKKNHEAKLKEKDSIQEKADKAEAEVLKVKSRLNKAESSVRDNEERIRYAENTMDRLRREISEAENDLKKKQEELGEKSVIIRDLEAQAKKLVL